MQTPTPHQNTHPHPTADAERRRESRRKIVVGAIALHLMERDARLREAVRARILERDADLFPSLMAGTTDGEEGR